MRALLGTYTRDELTTIKHYLEHAAEITSAAGAR
jgi:hypothetical protein